MLETSVLLLDAVSLVLLLVLVAMGLVVVFGMMGIINLAHGELVMVGAYIAAVLTARGVPFAAAALGAALGVGLLAWAVHVLLIRHVAHRVLDSILATWGLSLVLRQVIVLLFGPGSVNVALPVDATLTVGAFSYPVYRLVVMAVAVAVIAAAAMVVTRTRAGLLVRAVMARPRIAATLGIDPARVALATFMAGAAMAGLAGALVAPLVSVSPQMGVGYLVPAFLAILVGGAGSLAGVGAGGAVVGGLDSLLSHWMSPVVAQIVVFALAIAVIRLRPRGLMGGRE